MLTSKQIQEIQEREQALKSWRKEIGEELSTQSDIDEVKEELFEDNYADEAIDFWISAEADMPALLSHIREQDKEIERLKRELDAAIKFIPHSCRTCKHEKTNPYLCDSCRERVDRWEWRGAQK